MTGLQEPQLNLTLVEFLLARNEDTQRRARLWIDSPPIEAAKVQEALAEIRRCHTRILADCEAKEKIIDHVRHVRLNLGDVPGVGPDDTATFDRILMYLAEPDVDHPDFRPDWQVAAGDTLT